MDHDRRLLWLALACLAGYAVLLVLVVTGAVVDGVDTAVREAALAHRSAFLVDASDAFTDVVSPTTDAVVLGLGAAWLANVRRRLAPFLLAAVTGWTAAVIVIACKALVGRGAPGTGDVAGHSFPSGHTAMALVCLGALVLLATRRHRRLRRPLLATVALVTVLVAAALVYADFHWLTDTVASAFLGVGVLAGLELVLSRRTASPSSRTGTPPSGRTAPPR